MPDPRLSRRSRPRSRSPRQRLSSWFKWLTPGLAVKRWMAFGIAGALLAALGVAISINLTPVNRLLEFTQTLASAIADVLPNYVSGPIAIAVGLFLIFWAQSRTVGSIAEIFDREGDTELVDAIAARRRLNRGPKIVAIGGGTGLSTLLRGLKTYSTNITAIVTVADDGGSSGRLRREHGVLPPGDIRNCLAALADEEKLLTELFQYRFTSGNGLTGHSFGNLFLTAMSEVTGDLEQAIAASSRVLAVRGRVLPATLSDVCLWAELDDGRRIEGESNITAAGGKIERVGCLPANPPALPAALTAIAEADLIVLGPGSLYTSVLPNLLVPEIRAAIATARVPRLYICNIMTQPGETDGYSVADHIGAIDAVCGERLFDAVLVARRAPSERALARYAREYSHPVFVDREAIAALGRRLVIANVMEEDPDTGRVRHNSAHVARVLMRWYSRATHWKPTKAEIRALAKQS